MIKFIFDEQKATDATAFLLSLSENKLPYMKLMKLLYMAERISLSEYHYSITTDSYYLTKYGPVASGIYDCISHWDDLSDNSPWKNAITINKETYTAELKRKNCDFGMLSEEEKDILKAVNDEHCEEDEVEPSEYTQFPEETRISLSIEDIMKGTLEDKKEREEALSDLALSARLQCISFRNRGL